MERLCIASYMQNEHEFHLYTYNSIENIPEGTIVKDANDIISYDKIFYDSRGGVASFADWFRYKLLYERGGWWVDMDSVCLRHFDIESEFCFSSEYEYNSQLYTVNNGFIKSPPKIEFLQEMLMMVDKKIGEPIDWGDFGPRLLGRILKGYESNEYIQPPEVFCPISWNKVYMLISKQEWEWPKSAFAVHLWNEMWHIGRLDKDAVYHPDSIYERLKRKYGV